MSPDFSIITEVAGNLAHAEQLSMIHTRYKWAGEMAVGRDVLEAACGPGRGLGYLAARARSVIGGDLTPALIEAANIHYRGEPRAVVMDVQKMPFPDASFDLVLLFEALYYLPNPEEFLAEARRVLRRGGRLLISCPNPEWAEFNPSPFGIQYYSADRLRDLISKNGFNMEVLGGFDATPRGSFGRMSAVLKRAAVALGLMPRSMRGKAMLKRIFCGRLSELGPEIDALAPAETPIPVNRGPVKNYKVLYVDAKVRA